MRARSVCSSVQPVTRVNNDASLFPPTRPPLPAQTSFQSPLSTATDKLAGFSNYGATSVHLAAPGVNILSTIWMNETGSLGVKGYEYHNGTSMATPYVTGVAGLIKTVNSSLSVAQVKNAILNNVDPDSYLNGKVLTGGRLDAARAVSSVSGGTVASVAGAPAVSAQSANSLDLFPRQRQHPLVQGLEWRGMVRISVPRRDSYVRPGCDVKCR